VDIITELKDETLLEKYKLPKGSMTLVDAELSGQMDRETSGLRKTMASGGSAANTIHGLARLGIESAYVGKIGNDDLGRFFLKDMEIAGIYPILYQSFTETGRVMAYVSPDSERTMATCLGAAIELSADDIVPGIFNGHDYLYIEGYLINNHKLFAKAIQMGKENGLKVCVDLASFTVVDQYRDILQSDIQQVDIIFANEEEARSLTGLAPDDALKALAESCEIAVVKIGAEGSLIRKGNGAVHVPAPRVKSIDTTGAGDIYAAGFLYGLAHSLDLEKSGMIGTLLASRVIQVMGPKLPEEVWREVVGEIGAVARRQ